MRVASESSKEIPRRWYLTKGLKRRELVNEGRALHPEGRASRKALDWASFPGAVKEQQETSWASKGQGKGCNWNQRTKQWLKPPRASILKALAFTLSEIRGSGRFLRREPTGMTFKKKSELTLKLSCLELAKLSPKFQAFTMKTAFETPKNGPH